MVINTIINHIEKMAIRADGTVDQDIVIAAWIILSILLACILNTVLSCIFKVVRQINITMRIWASGWPPQHCDGEGESTWTEIRSEEDGSGSGEEKQ